VAELHNRVFRPEPSNWIATVGRDAARADYGRQRVEKVRYDDFGGELGRTDYRAPLAHDADFDPQLKAALEWQKFRTLCGLEPHEKLEVIGWRQALDWAAVFFADNESEPAEISNELPESMLEAPWINPGYLIRATSPYVVIPVRNAPDYPIQQPSEGWTGTAHVYFDVETGEWFEDRRGRDDFVITYRRSPGGEIIAVETPRHYKAPYTPRINTCPPGKKKVTAAKLFDLALYAAWEGDHVKAFKLTEQAESQQVEERLLPGKRDSRKSFSNAVLNNGETTGVNTRYTKIATAAGYGAGSAPTATKQVYPGTNDAVGKCLKGAVFHDHPNRCAVSNHDRATRVTEFARAGRSAEVLGNRRLAALFDNATPAEQLQPADEWQCTECARLSACHKVTETTHHDA
jgi:hypothetical protein